MKKKCTKCNAEKHITEFYINRARKDGHSSLCKNCDNANNKKWAKNNRTKMNSYIKKWENANKERICSYRKKYKQENRTEIRRKGREYAKEHRKEKREYDKIYSKENKDKKNAQWHRRRARIKNSNGNISDNEWIELLRKYDSTCLCCGSKKDICMDHVIPLAKNGEHNINNIQPLCRSCNSKKGAKVIDYRPQI